MYKVFLAEDESIVREGLRDTIPWEQYGFAFAGEAPDGEIALPLIRKLKPDLLITDIKMPFMDGLSLARIVHTEFPSMKIVILSGYNDFEYARKAIEVGVDQYLSKPVTRKAMQAALVQIREKLENEQQQEQYLKQYADEQQEYEQFRRRRFFDRVFSGNLSVEEIYQEAGKLHLDITGPAYRLVLMEVTGPAEAAAAPAAGKDDHVYLCQEELVQYFMRFPEFLFFRWDHNTFGAVVKGDPETVEVFTQRALDKIREAAERSPGQVEWYACTSESVGRFSSLRECYRQAGKLFAGRFLEPERHILTPKDPSSVTGIRSEEKMPSMDGRQIDPQMIRHFLKDGKREEVEEFTRGFLTGASDAVLSRMFRDYLLLHTRFCVMEVLREMGVEETRISTLDPARLQEAAGGTDTLQDYLAGLLEEALDARDAREGVYGSGVLKKALDYIDENFASEELSLAAAAQETGVSPGYLSSLFSGKMEMTFVEYVTDKRMDRAKQLLRQSKEHTAQVAAAVGYRDPHYFSFVFKKTVGCTPREYRNQGGS